MLGGGRAVPLTTSNAIVEKDKEIKELNRKNNYLRRQNDELLKGQFENENRVRWLTERLGFATAQEAETQLADSDITLLQLQVEYETAQARIRHLEEDALLNEEAYSVLRHEHDVTLKHNAELEQDLNELNWSRQCIQSSVESQVAELNLELHERASVIAKLQAQSVPLRSRVLSSSPAGKENIIVRRSQSFVPSSPQSPSKSTSPTRKKNVPSPAAFLQAQLNDLQERYDSLLRIYRENVQQRTKERKVWKEFKETWAEGIQRGRRDARRLELGQSGTDSPRKRRKMTEERERAATAAIQHASTPVQPKTPRPVQESQTQYEEDPLPPSQDQGGGAAIAGALTSEVLVPASSETDLEESQEQYVLHGCLRYRSPF
ncbi:hypothetical protein CALVIDRAFT_58552 [Calocera viscosa TUFC12733]|uniref:Uncharacterized protein n=1 Tax=Calocera viscosa (strain TUFC12733) TaxID=1330018 RepID=A0A167NHN3_CALVF|nr:hypothetical protein CALVIDRAFT_58552 [Calocera viscosa TUFC12733]